MPCGGPLISGTPEDLILTGKINQLLPTEKFHFNALTGKIQASIPVVYSQIRGPEEVVQWLKLALSKNGIEIGDEVRITAQKDPIQFMLEKDGKEKVLATIQEVVNELSVGKLHR